MRSGWVSEPAVCVTVVVWLSVVLLSQDKVLSSLKSAFVLPNSPKIDGHLLLEIFSHRTARGLRRLVATLNGIGNLRS